MFLKIKYLCFTEYTCVSIFGFTDQYFCCLFNYQANTHPNWNFIEQIILFISNCRASAHLDFEELTCFRSVEYNSVYQLFLVRDISRTRISWYTRRYLSICTRNYWYAARCIDMYQNMSAKNIIFSGQKWFTK